MTNKQFAKSERQFTVGLLKKLQPKQWQASTLCAGWIVEDLAAHLVTRERSLIGGVGLVVPALHKLHDNRIKKVEQKGHEYIIKKLEHYPSHMPASVNTAEFWVHNEDFLRGDLQMSRPAANKEENEVLWSSLKGLAKVRKSLVKGLGNVALINTENKQRINIRFAGNNKDTTVAGTAGELLLYFYGRRDVARVKITKDL